MTTFLKNIFISFILFFVSFGFAYAESSSITVSQEVIDDTQNNSNNSNTSNGGGVNTNPIPSILNTSILIKNNSAEIKWTTNEATKFRFYWGENINYLNGIFSEESFNSSHKVVLSNLDFDKEYFFEIEVENSLGYKSFLTGQKFKTEKQKTINPPSNIKNLKISLKDNDVFLEWNNPEDKNFKAVRIVRSDKFYPLDPKDGLLVFEGNRNYFLDENTKVNKLYYYSIFTYDEKFNYSSGAVISIFIPDNSEKDIGNDDKKDIILEKEKEKAPKKEKKTDKIDNDKKEANKKEDIFTELNLNVEKLTIGDFKFSQGNREVRIFNNKENIKIEGDKNLKISIDYDKVPEVLKTIMMTLKDPKDPEKTFSFLLRVNKDKDAYEAEIAPLERPGNYEVNISVFDYKNQNIKKIKSNLAVMTDNALNIGKLWVGFVDKMKWVLIFVLFFVAVWVIFKFSRMLNRRV